MPWIGRVLGPQYPGRLAAPIHCRRDEITCTAKRNVRLVYVVFAQGLLDLPDSKVHLGSGEHLDRVDFRVLEGNKDSKV